MSQKWNLQDIRPAEPRKRRKPTERPTRVEESFNTDNDGGSSSEQPINKIKKNGNHKKIWLSAVIFLVIVGGALGLSALLGETELTIYPEHKQPTINSEFTTYAESRSGSLSYEVLTLEAVKEREMTATGQTEVQEQAQGTIEIRKTTPGNERLIKNTRFRNDEGLVFRIQESVVVPGATTNSSGETVPGSIQITAFADDVGEEYNIPSGTRFDIPGFEESGLTELYEAMYATSITDFTGGFDGPQYEINDEELAAAREDLQSQLRTELEARIETEKPAGFITFPGAVTFTFAQLPAVETGEGTVNIQEKGVLRVPLFKNTEFGSFLASESIASYNGSPVRVEDHESLEFNYSSSSVANTDISSQESLTFQLAGEPLLIWEYDAESLKSELAGLPKTAINNAITAYPGIEGAKVNITPFWKSSFPEDPEDIVVIEELRNSDQ